MQGMPTLEGVKGSYDWLWSIFDDAMQKSVLSLNLNKLTLN